MTFWGYNITKTRTIQYDNNSKELMEYVYREVPSSKTCIGCGGCTAGCTAGNLTDFNIRKLHTLIRRGEEQMAQEQLNTCMLCGKCTLVCPRGVEIRKMLLSMHHYFRNICKPAR